MGRVLTEILEKEAKLPRRNAARPSACSKSCVVAVTMRPRQRASLRKAWRNERARVPVHAYVPMSFVPGEAYQFDWSHETITLQNLPLTIKAAHMKRRTAACRLCALLPETQELVFDAHDKAFQFYGGVCRRGIYDNMKTAVEASLSARRASTTAAFCRCARIT